MKENEKLVVKYAADHQETLEPVGAVRNTVNAKLSEAEAVSPPASANTLMKTGE